MSAADFKAPPTHSSEAEQSAIGCMLLDAGAADAAVGMLDPRDFFELRHQIIFGALRDMVRSGKVPDAIAAFVHLQGQGLHDEAGGLPYLNSLAACVATADNLEFHAGEVRKYAQWRDLLRAADELRAAALDPQGRTAEQITAGLIERVRRIGEGGDPEKSWELPAAATPAEMAAARLHPRCIVENYLYADVATLIAPGSTGKTTAMLFESVHIALGRSLWGLRVFAPGPTLIVTAEDRREFLLARLREICAALRLSDDETTCVRELVRIDDRTAKPRRLTEIRNDAVAASEFGAAIANGCKAREFAPAIVIFDPMVSFGVGEARVNDAEQALIEAGRIIVAGLDCCVRYVHHTGKGPALEKRTDQYSGRGGSSLADGTRMVAVMASMTEADLIKATGEPLGKDSSAFRLERPKVSYAPPNQPPIFVRRTRYAFESVRALQPRTEAEQDEATGEQLARFLISSAEKGLRWTVASLEAAPPGSLGRNEVRRGLAWLEARGRLLRPETLGPDGKPPKSGARYHLAATRRAGGDPCP